MKIAGFQSHSMVDFPNNLACVVFTQGCNMNCWYCHNSSLISLDANETLTSSTVLSKIMHIKDMIDGVVISGGEPTLQNDLIPFIMAIRSNTKLKIKLDTNGTNPFMINELITARIIDYIAMDIKSPYYKHYSTNIDLAKIKESIDLLIQNKRNLKVEFRTTVVPALTFNDLEYIKKHMIYNYGYYYLQQYRKVKDSDPDPHSDKFLLDTAKKLECKVRGLK